MIPETGQQQDVKEGESGWVPKGVIPRASIRRLQRNCKIVLEYDVITLQQPICQEARYREEATPYNPR